MKNSEYSHPEISNTDTKKKKERDLIDLLYKIVLDLDTNVKLYL